MKEHADMVAKLRRVGKGLGVYQFDQVNLAIAGAKCLPFKNHPPLYSDS